MAFISNIKKLFQFVTAVAMDPSLQHVLQLECVLANPTFLEPSAHHVVLHIMTIQIAMVGAL